MKVTKKTFKFGRHNVTLETGRIARQASGAVWVDMEGTVVLVTAVAVKKADPKKGFFPLTVNYQERTYAAGLIPGNYFRREGRPSEPETLISRLIDRPIRPLFPDGFMNEVQIIATVKSLNPDASPDIAAMLGASAALMLSGAPWGGPIAAARVGYKDGEFLLNPSPTMLETSELDLVVAGTRQAVLMVESEAKELPEDIMLGAVMYGHAQFQTAIDAIVEFAEEAGGEEWEWQAPEANKALAAEVAAFVQADIAKAYEISEKLERRDQLAVLKSAVIAKFAPEGSDVKPEALEAIFADIEKEHVRHEILWAVYVLMVVTIKRSVRLQPKLAFCHAHTVRRCSHVVKHRRSWLRRWVQPAMHKVWMV